MKPDTKRLMRGLKRLRQSSNSGYSGVRGSYTRNQLAKAHKSNRKSRGKAKHRGHISSYYGYE